MFILRTWESMKSTSRIPILSSSDPGPWNPRDQVAVEPSLCPIVPAALIHGEPCLRFRPLILANSFRIVFQTETSSVLREAISYDIPLQRFSLELPVHLGRPDLLAIDENRGFLDAQKKNSLSLGIRLLKNIQTWHSPVWIHRHKSLCIGWNVWWTWHSI